MDSKEKQKSTLNTLSKTNTLKTYALLKKNEQFHSLTILAVNEVIHKWFGNILKQLYLGGLNSKHFFKGVLSLKESTFIMR